MDYVADDMMTKDQVAEWEFFVEEYEAYDESYQAYGEIVAEGFASFYGNCSDPYLTAGDVARELGLTRPVPPVAPSFEPARDAAPYPFKDQTRFTTVGDPAYEPF